MVRRGTVQHEILIGEAAPHFSADESLTLRVNCVADAGALDESVPYALVATLEVAEGEAIPIYEEIEARVRALVPVMAD